MVHEFKHPFTCMLVGATSCGKTHWLKELIENIGEMTTPRITKVLYCYGELNGTILGYEREGLIKTHKGVPLASEIQKLGQGCKLLVVLDDLVFDTSEEFLSNLFTRGSHNWDISVILVTQHMFTKNTRTARSNSHYFVLMRNPGGMLQIRTLGSQLFAGRLKFFTACYNDATKDPYSYLLIDMHPQTPDNMRLKTYIYPSENTITYVPK